MNTSSRWQRIAARIMQQTTETVSGKLFLKETEFLFIEEDLNVFRKMILIDG